MSHQLNIIQCFFCFMGIVLYYLTYFLIGAVVYSDSKNTAAHQMSTGIYWLLIIFVSFVVEGLLVMENTARSINMLIR